MKLIEELGISPWPWSVRCGSTIYVNDANGKRVCERISFRGNDADAAREEASNACLIAFAPELYEALRKCVEEMECGHYCAKCKNHGCIVAKSKAALAKAAGEEVRDE